MSLTFLTSQQRKINCNKKKIYSSHHMINKTVVINLIISNPIKQFPRRESKINFLYLYCEFLIYNIYKITIVQTKCLVID